MSLTIMKDPPKFIQLNKTYHGKNQPFINRKDVLGIAPPGHDSIELTNHSIWGRKESLSIANNTLHY